MNRLEQVCISFVKIGADGRIAVYTTSSATYHGVKLVQVDMNEV